jgi:hypothetical protein
MGARTLSMPPQVMAIRHAVPKTPPKYPVPRRSPIHKSSLFPTPSESTLPQLLIPPHFKSFITNAYKKPGGGAWLSAQSLSTRHSRLSTAAWPEPSLCVPTEIPATPFRSYVYFITRTPPAGGRHTSTPLSIFEFRISIFEFRSEPSAPLPTCRGTSPTSATPLPPCPDTSWRLCCPAFASRLAL